MLSGVRRFDPVWKGQDVALTIDDELAALEKATGLDEKHQGAISKHSARLAAAVQLESAHVLASSSDSCRVSEE